MTQWQDELPPLIPVDTTRVLSGFATVAWQHPPQMSVVNHADYATIAMGPPQVSFSLSELKSPLDILMLVIWCCFLSSSSVVAVYIN